MNVNQVRSNSVSIIKLILVIALLILSIVLVGQIGLSLRGILFGAGFFVCVGVGVSLAISVFTTENALLPFISAIVLLLAFIFPVVQFIALF